ncbi:MAG TPA: hypothetical protein VJC39_00155 [Candidatus Nanoarchaeia archaeon]|nr:hypothetical protein [Candidatus Nanoarchaeia archaeon]
MTYRRVSKDTVVDTGPVYLAGPSAELQDVSNAPSGIEAAVSGTIEAVVSDQQIPKNRTRKRLLTERSIHTTPIQQLWLTTLTETGKIVLNGNPDYKRKK